MVAAPWATYENDSRGCSVTLSNWMIPELPLSGELQLESHKREVRACAETNPREVAELACVLMTQLRLQESITRKATHRIAELELRELLGSATEEPSEVYILPGKVGILMRIALAVGGHRKLLACVRRA